MTRLVVLLAALLAAAAAVQGSQATFTASATNNGSSFATAAKFATDTTSPTATRVLAVNASGGTAGRIDAGDMLTFTYSEPVAPASVKSGWDGSSTSVQVTFSKSNDRITVDGTNLGYVTTGGNYFTSTSTVTSTMALSADGTSIAVTLGAPSGSRTVAGGNMTWTIGAGVTDVAGNTIVTPATWSETGNTRDF